MIKNLSISFYWCISLLALCGEPKEDITLKLLAVYYIAAIANLTVASYFVNRFIINQKHEITTNRNRIPQCID